MSQPASVAIHQTGISVAITQTRVNVAIETALNWPDLVETGLLGQPMGLLLAITYGN